MAATTVREHFAQDHDRLDALFETFQSLKRSNFAAAKEAFKSFKAGLQRHIVWEEDVLFPLWEEKCGVAEGGPTLVMRAEHRQIGEQLEAIHDKVAEHDPESGHEEQVLLDILRAHNRKEEQVLYPAIDRVTEPEERAELFRKLEHIPPERYAACCGAHHKTSSEPL
jgi:iron-sulfur cluster repair protein YtfE (RIC family)